MTLRATGELLVPDKRHQSEVAIDQTTGQFRSLGIEDMHALVEAYELSLTVPETIRSQFDLARYAFIYSYFAYEMATLAEQQSYSTLEFALRMKILQEDGERDGGGLKKLVRTAHDRGWLLRSEFEIDMGSGQPVSILELAVDLRNNLAHGQPHLFPQGSLEMIALCCRTINSLFATGGGDGGI